MAWIVVGRMLGRGNQIAIVMLASMYFDFVAWILSALRTHRILHQARHLLFHNASPKSLKKKLSFHADFIHPASKKTP